MSPLSLLSIVRVRSRSQLALEGQDLWGDTKFEVFVDGVSVVTKEDIILLARLLGNIPPEEKVLALLQKRVSENPPTPGRRPLPTVIGNVRI